MDKIKELRDWRVRIPLITPENEPAGDVVFRLPAADRDVAVRLAQDVALHVAEATGATVDLADLDPVDVGDEPSIDEVRYIGGQAQAEATYLKKVLVALANKFPMMLLLTEDEFNAADEDALAASPGPDGLMAFITHQTFGAMMDARGKRTRPEPVTDEEAELLPAHDVITYGELTKRVGSQVRIGSTWFRVDQVTTVADPMQVTVTVPDGREFTFPFGLPCAVRRDQPVLDGEEDDPQVRRVRAWRLARDGFRYGPLHVLDQGRWRVLDRVSGPSPNGVVMLHLDGVLQFNIDQHDLVTCRPMSWTVDGAQLTSDKAIGRQVLVDGEWRIIVGGARMADKAGWFEVVTGPPEHHVAVERGDQFQVRDVPNGWA